VAKVNHTKASLVMRDLLTLLAHWMTIVATLLGPGGFYRVRDVAQRISDRGCMIGSAPTCK
jgi:hypothetical protein